jgi:hypothetical protein
MNQETIPDKMTTVNVPEMLEARTWTFAKTMPRNPHFWSVIKDWPTPEDFHVAVMYIREHGVEKLFYGKPYTVFYLNGWRYWAMGNDSGEIYIINRAEIDQSDPEWAREGLASPPE